MRNRTKIKKAEQVSLLISEEIARVTSSGIPVIAEGAKDRASLQALGIENIIVLNKPLYAVIESISAKNVAILTDLDAEGRKLYHGLKSGLVSRGVKADDRLRLLLLKAKIMHVESLYRAMEKWKSAKE